MQEYDIALKMLLKGSAALTLRALTGTAVAKWLDVELPTVRKAQNLRLDLLSQTAGGQLIHIELQSGNDAAMPFRMIEFNGCSDNSRGRFCSMWAKRPCACKTSCAARICRSNM